VHYRVIKPLGERGKTQNISEGGICLMLQRELSPGTKLELKFELPSEKSKLVEALAEVVWQKKTDRGFLTGVSFQK
jgi:c-di-GMP-binding flagellar brake protein YcgR